MKTPFSLLLKSLLVLAIILSATPAMAQNYTWGSGATWSTATWTGGPNPAPELVGDTAIINSGAANQNLSYDTGATGALGTLTLNTTTGFVNEVSLAKSLTVANALTLGASGGGTSEIAVAAGTVLTTTSDLTINSGGNLTVASNSGADATVGGNFTVNSGVVSIGSAGNLILDGATNSVNATTGSSLSNVELNGTAAIGTAQSFTSNFALGGTTIIQSSAAMTTTLTNTASGTNVNALKMNANTSGILKLKLGSNITTGSAGLTSTGAAVSSIKFTIDTNGNNLNMSAMTQFAPKSGTSGSTTDTEWLLTDSATGGVIEAGSFDLSQATKGTFGTSGVVVSGDLVLDATGGNSSVNNLGTGTNHGTIASTSTFLYSGTAAVGTAATLSTISTGGFSRSIGNLTVQNGALQLTGGHAVTIGSGAAVNINSGGTLELNSASTASILAGAPTVNVGNGTGTGTFDLEGVSDTVGAVVLGGGGTIQSTGGTTNSLTATGLTWNSGSTLAFNLDGGSTNTTSLSLSGALTMGTAGTFNISLTGSGTMTTTGTYDLINFTGGTTFTSVSQFNLQDASLFAGSSLTGTLAFGTNQLDFIVATSVPEPGTWAMMLGGLAVLVFIQTRRRKNNLN